MEIEIVMIRDGRHIDLFCRLGHPNEKLFGARGLGRITGALHEAHKEFGIVRRAVLFHAAATLAWGLMTLEEEILKTRFRT